MQVIPLRSCVDYSSILLKVYIEIAQTGNYWLLVKTGNWEEKELVLQWDLIVKECSKQSGHDTFSRYINSLRSYGKLIAEYEKVKLDLCTLTMVVDSNSLEYLNSKGYRIDTSLFLPYCQSLQAAFTRSDFMLTHIKMKYNELKRIKESEGKQEKISLEATLAAMSYALGFNIDDNVTLARFNEWQKLLRKKQSASNTIKKQNVRA